MEDFFLKPRKAGRSQSVMAATIKVADDWKPPIFPKSDEQAAMLETRVKGIFFMQGLEVKEIDTLVKAFEQKKYGVGDVLMKQGEEGECFYVLEEGITDVLIDNVGKVAEKNGATEANFVGE
jgi:cAMP-dependent protein kinase regulator